MATRAIFASRARVGSLCPTSRATSGGSQPTPARREPVGITPRHPDDDVSSDSATAARPARRSRRAGPSQWVCLVVKEAGRVVRTPVLERSRIGGAPLRLVAGNRGVLVRG